MHCNTAKELLKKLEENNQMFSQEQMELLQKITNSQHPKITLLTCSDSRLDVSYFKLDAIDKVFVIRNIWNNILTSEGSIDYGVEHLETPVLFILAHTNCGAVKAAIQDYHHCTPDIKRELDHLMPALVECKSNNFEEKWVEWVEKNLELQIKIAEDKFKDRIEEWKLTIVGAILDVDDSYKWWIWKIYIKQVVWKEDIDVDLDI